MQDGDDERRQVASSPKFLLSLFDALCQRAHAITGPGRPHQPIAGPARIGPRCDHPAGARLSAQTGFCSLQAHQFPAESHAERRTHRPQRLRDKA